MQLAKSDLASRASFALAAVLTVGLLTTAPARAEEIKAGDLVITQAWSRATPGGAKVGGGYLTIENKGTAPDRLFGGASDAAGKVQVSFDVEAAGASGPAGGAASGGGMQMKKMSPGMKM